MQTSLKWSWLVSVLGCATIFSSGAAVRQENLDREVAVKVLPPWYAADRNFVVRFNLEARLIARLSHPNIVTVHDFNESNGHLYIVMQLVDGGTLKQILDTSRDAVSMGTSFPPSMSSPNAHPLPGTMDVLEANRIFQQLDRKSVV